MKHRVLLDRDLTYTWLDAAVRCAATGPTPTDARKCLDARLREESLGKEARIKTLTALSRTWITPHLGARSLIDWALTHTDDLLDSRPLHLGAMLATQPFFADQIAIIGRILTVQPDVNTLDVRTRMRAIWGSRASVDRSVQHNIKTMRSLQLLTGNPKDSISQRTSPIEASPSLGAWLAGCLMVARDRDAISESELATAPELWAIKMPKVLEIADSGLRRTTEGGGRSVLLSSPA